jgi:hypothetical protein
LRNRGRLALDLSCTLLTCRNTSPGFASEAVEFTCAAMLALEATCDGNQNDHHHDPYWANAAKTSQPTT